MKLNITSLLLFFIVVVNAQLRIPSLSPNSKIVQKIGLTEVTIEYSRPSARGRVIFGEKGLLSNNVAWRVGANTATKISFTKSVYIKGNELKKGDYTILVIPTEKKWIVNWYKYTNSNWSAYVKKTPLFSSEFAVKKNSKLIETLEMRFQNLTMSSADLIIEWEYSKIKIPFTIEESETILATIDRKLKGPSSFDYYNAALYLHETKRDLLTALKYIQKATESDKALFFQVTREALILKDLKEYKKAKMVAKKALKLSVEAKNNDFIKLNEKILKEL